MEDPDLLIWGGGGGHPNPEMGGRGWSPKKFFWPCGPHFGQKVKGGRTPLDPPLAYMYADQTSKLLIIFLCCLICICDFYTKVFQWKNLKTNIWLSLLCCFLSMYVFLDILSLKTLTISAVQTILHL